MIRYRVDAIGINERLLAKCPPGWSAKELLDELLTRTVRIVAFDFPFSIPGVLLRDEQFAVNAGYRHRAFIGWRTFNAFVAERLPLDEPLYCAGADVMGRKRIKPGQLVDVTLTPQERDLILERTLIDDEMEGRLRGATHRGSNLVVRLTLDDVDDLVGHVAAEADLQRFFRVTPPVVHQMIETLAARGFIDREPGTARSIRLRLTRAQLPEPE